MNMASIANHAKVAAVIMRQQTQESPKRVDCLGFFFMGKAGFHRAALVRPWVAIASPAD